MSLADTLDGFVELVDFSAEPLQRTAVQQRRFTVHVQFAVCVGDGEHGFLHRSVRNLSIQKDTPGHQCPVETFLKGIHPTRA